MLESKWCGVPGLPLEAGGFMVCLFLRSFLVRLASRGVVPVDIWTLWFSWVPLRTLLNSQGGSKVSILELFLMILGIQRSQNNV